MLRRFFRRIQMRHQLTACRHVELHHAPPRLRRIPFLALFFTALLAACTESTPSGAGGTGGGGTGGMSGRGGSGSGGTGGSAGTGGNAGTGGSAGTGGTAPRDAAADRAPTPADGGRADVAARDGGNADRSPADAATSAGPFTLTSTAFQMDGDVAPMYRCRTENLSPPLAWTPGPPGTRSYAITMAHNAALHWALWDIPVTTTSLPMDVAKVPMPPVPAGSKQAKPNVDGSTWYGYSGPCPGGPNQTYDFIVYALDVPVLPDITPDSAIRQAVINTIRAHTIARATLVGRASR
jgi:Raf kinase inhibitor-like YbhB/YbcL family protein